MNDICGSHGEGTSAEEACSLSAEKGIGLVLIRPHAILGWFRVLSG